MAIADAKKRRIGRELVDWILLGVETGARRSTEEYRQRVSTEPQLAKQHLVRAVNMPRRARLRVQKWIDDYDAANGQGTGQAFLSECLGLAGTVTLAQLNAELAALEAKAQTVINNNAGGATLDQVATAIENNLNYVAQEWQFPLPVAYSDIDLIG